MYLVIGGQSEGGEPYHVFVEQAPGMQKVPSACRVVSGVNLIAHPLSDDPDAPTVSTVLYRDPDKPNSYHYLLSPHNAGRLVRVALAPYVYPSWEEFACYHPSELERMSG